MVAEGCRILSALAPLAVLLQEAGDHSQRCPGTVAALQPQSDDHKSYGVTSKSEVWPPSLPSISHVVTSVARLLIKGMTVGCISTIIC